MTRGFMLDWQAAALAGSAVCGGKGWNLGRLDRYGFKVPDGGVVIAECYRRFVADPKLAHLIQAAAFIDPRSVSDAPVVERLSEIRQAMMSTALPPEVSDSVLAYLDLHGLSNVLVAVRSSATAEDSVLASFAGIHQTSLDVRGSEEILTPSDGATAHCGPHKRYPTGGVGLLDEEVDCAVVICTMVAEPGSHQPQAAGVTFTCDPRTGHLDLITISAAPGIGEQVVSGTVNPEEITLASGRGYYKILKRTGRGQPVLTDEQAQGLARMCDRVHWALGDGQQPQDVEWAFDGTQFWLLQARPATNLPRLTFPEIADLPQIWSNGNLKDAVAGVLSPHSWSLTQPVIREIIYSTLVMAGYPKPDGQETIRRFSGRAYFDLGAMQWVNYDALGLMPSELNRTLGGHQPEIPVPAGHPFSGPSGRRRQRARLRFAVSLIRGMRTLPRLIERVKAGVNSLLRVDLQSCTNEELLEVAARIRSLQEEFGGPFQMANVNAGSWIKPLQELLERLLPGSGASIAVSLMAGTGNVTSAEQGYRLFDLAAAVQQDPSAGIYLNAQPFDPQGWVRLSLDSPFRRALEAYLNDFGHRAVYEIELTNPRWSEDPTYLLDQVRRLVKLGKTRAPRADAQAIRQSAEDSIRKIGIIWRPLIRWLVRKNSRGAALREESKSVLVRVLQPYRRLALESGRRMVEAGLLDHQADIFYLTALDLEMFLRGHWDGRGARSLVLDRKRRNEVWQQETPPDVFVLDQRGNPTAMPEVLEPLAPNVPRVNKADGQVLTGIAVASGRATGVARLILHPSEGHLLQDGDVLVAPSTDPGWTPLFLRASAVVMEVGGYLSHGAIVAREYGLPAVVNIPGLLLKVKSGQQLEVDGTKGTVTMV